TLIVNIGVAYRNLGDPIRALREFDRAEDLIAAGDHAALSNLSLDRALVRHLNLFDFDAAMLDYKRAVLLGEQSGASENLAALYYLARLYLDRDELDAARDLYARVLKLATESGTKAGQWSAQEGLARLALRAQEPESALSLLEQAMSLIETTRAGLDDGRLRLEFFGSQHSVFQLAIEAAWLLFEQSGQQRYAATAFEISQRAKARELLTILAPHRSGVTLPESVEPPILEFFFGDTHLYAWLINRDRLLFRQLGPTSLIAVTVRQVHDDLLATGNSDRLGDLSAMLLAPLTNELGTVERIIIAPDRVLFHLPFELLKLRDAPLIDTHVLSYAPSTSVVHSLKRSSALSPIVFAGFGALDDAMIENSAAARYALPRLPNAADELRQLDRVLPGKHTLALGRDATEAGFVRALSGGARIAHVATHAVFDDRLGPAIVLAADSQSDGLLFPGEISSQTLDVRLTVLAACSTAVGGIEDGRAISSLTGALLSAGSSAVLATLWDVQDSYATYFIAEFYRELARGRTPVLALHNTKTTLRDLQPGDAAPWAAFVLVGDTGALVQRQPDYGYLLAGLASLGALWLLRRRLRG
ncbi:MAG: CHAT domain-containing protein, partial [Gammaproteobacteria bacterium]|nr:CHAT domain-containing protein [Gammaproteobacteria bacterium]